MEGHIKFLRELHRPILNNFSPQTGQFQHLIIAYLIKFNGGRNNPGIGGIYTVNIGKYLTDLRFQYGGQSNSGGVRPPPSQSGNIVLEIITLKPGYHHNLIFFE